MGRDVYGAKQVNLVPSERPANLYAEVAKLVSIECLYIVSILFVYCWYIVCILFVYCLLLFRLMRKGRLMQCPTKMSKSLKY